MITLSAIYYVELITETSCKNRNKLMPTIQVNKTQKF